MAIIGIIVGLIAAAIGLVGGLVGLGFGLLGGALGLLPHLFPIVLITIGIVWLVKRSNARSVPAISVDRNSSLPPRTPPVSR